MLRLDTTVVSVDTRISNARLKGLNYLAARNTKNVVSWDMLLKIAEKIPKTKERGARIGYPGKKEDLGGNRIPR